MAAAVWGSGVRLIVGLGNYGIPTGLHMRHSVGMQSLLHLGESLGLSWRSDNECKGYMAEHAGMHFLRPKCLMNVNGTSVARAVQVLGITDPAQVLLIHDDLEIEVGKIKEKLKGSANGNNGVRSVIQALGSDAMPRLRIGIGRPQDRSQVVSFVLSPFAAEEAAVLRQTVFPEITTKLTTLLYPQLAQTARRSKQQPPSQPPASKSSCLLQ